MFSQNIHWRDNVTDVLLKISQFYNLLIYRRGTGKVLCNRFGAGPKQNMRMIQSD